MQPSGAPDVGDLVMCGDWASFHRWHTHPTPGIVLECRGIECLVLWTSNIQDWRPRTLLKVINERR